jgi:hypothetical protein
MWFMWAVLLGRLGKQLEVLVVVDLDERDTVSAVLALQLVRLGKTQEVLIECLAFSRSPSNNPM